MYRIISDEIEKKMMFIKIIINPGNKFIHIPIKIKNYSKAERISKILYGAILSDYIQEEKNLLIR